MSILQQFDALARNAVFSSNNASSLQELSVEAQQAYSANDSKSLRKELSKITGFCDNNKIVTKENHFCDYEKVVPGHNSFPDATSNISPFADETKVVSCHADSVKVVNFPDAIDVVNFTDSISIVNFPDETHVVK